MIVIRVRIVLVLVFFFDDDGTIADDEDVSFSVVVAVGFFLNDSCC
jgi:hypothetical protein